MIWAASIVMVATWSCDCPLLSQFRSDRSYILFGGQDRIVSIFESQKYPLDDEIKAFESCKDPRCPSSCFTEISLYRIWKSNCHEGTTNPQLRGFKECLQTYFWSSWCAFEHWKAYGVCGWSGAAMISCQRCIDGWLLQNSSLALNQAAPLRRVRSTEIVV